MAKPYRSPFTKGVTLTCAFKKTGTQWAAGYHPGEDYVPADGSSSNVTLVSPAQGTIVRKNDCGAAYGNHIVIKTTDNRVILMAHMQNSSPFGVGATVKPGDPVGMMGNSGATYSAPHLHIELENSTVWNYNKNLLQPSDYIDFANVSSSTPTPSTPSTTLTVSVSASKTSGTTNDKFNFFATTNVTASKVTLQFNGNSTVYQMSSSDKKNWSLNGNTLNAGNRTITITAYDVSGRTAAKTLSVAVGNPGTQQQPSTQRTYVVVKGDTLSAIGAKFGVKWQNIASTNNIAAPNYVIFPGQKLVIPAA
ncbi:MAG: peptidoglycan DD-metalloendopeptidase family protein [Peptococcaceae bacterium]|nr:peptidoglycan DD-metalloendopeptidase family protein [Peptococcaceae bacterium]